MSIDIIDKYGVVFILEQAQFDSLNLNIDILKDSLLLNGIFFSKRNSILRKDSIEINLFDFSGEPLSLEISTDRIF